MSKKENMTKKQHYVPRFYLRNFTDADGYLWTYDIQNECIKKVTHESICAKKYLYETRFEHANAKVGEFVIPNDIEKIYSKYEGEFSSLIKKIQAICIPGLNENISILNTSEKDVLFSFIANLCLRNPQNMERIKVSELSDEVYASEEYKSVYYLLNEMGMGGTESVFIAAQKKAILTKEIPNSFPEQMKKQLSNLIFVFLYAQEDTFLTSDMPVVVGDDPSIKNDDPTCLFLSLTPKIAVLFGNYPQLKKTRNRMVPIKSDIVNRFNQHLFEKTQYSMRRWIISPSKSQIEACIGEAK